MSKSKGNIIDPIDLIDGIDIEALVAKRTSGLMQPHLRDKIEKNTRKQFPSGIPAHGTDALRFTFAALATMGRDIRFDLGRIEGYKNFCNKIWNATRYVQMNLEGVDHATLASGDIEYSIADRWIRSRLGAMIETVRAKLAEYRFDLASQALYEFAWYEYCDWYLELSKPTLQSTTASDAQKRGARRTLVEVLEAYLRLLHPLMPFITEEIWQSVAPIAGKQGPTIMLQSYPKRDDFAHDESAERAIAPVKAAILGARQIRGQLDIPRSRQMPSFIKTSSAEARRLIEENRTYVVALANLSDLQFVDDESTLPPTAMQLVDGETTHVPLASIIDDPDAELARLAKRKAKVRQDLAKCEGKLNNQNFVANAPAEIVEQERTRIADFKQEIAQLEEQEHRVALLKQRK
jgi:valyl-tRNA synthetase